MQILNEKDWEKIYRMAHQEFINKAGEDRYFLCKCIIKAYTSIMLSKGYSLKKVK